MLYSPFYKKVTRGLLPGGVLFLALPEILLLFAVFALVVITIRVCTAAVMAPASMTAIENYLRRLQSKFAGQVAIDPERERGTMERLQKAVKSSCHQDKISANKNLQALSVSSCQSISGFAEKDFSQNQMAWIKLRALVCGFHDSYFPAGK